jgi:hypothetical protein
MGVRGWRRKAKEKNDVIMEAKAKSVAPGERVSE